MSRGQLPLSKVEINIDYNDRFYDKGELITTNDFVYTDSVYVYIAEHLIEKGADFSDFEKHKHGKWVEYFDKNWKPITDSSKAYYFSLTEYEIGLAQFFFDKNNKIHHITLRYPPYKDEIFKGYRIIWYDDKENVKTIQYERFVDQLNSEYVNRTTYFADGNIESYTLRDAQSSNYHIIEYDKRGQITYELVANSKEQYKSKKKCFGRVEIRESREDGISYKSKLVKGNLKWKKEIED